ncbi:MAG: GNAT family N-acetyltransferase [Gammaproteobacteria bacterium]|jgi:GNAT superfamily N-acetyltransferase/predicted nucleotidyltransferase|nr:GNAT family N-acetyltransferase [Gammaproteobacteria bacterium]
MKNCKVEFVEKISDDVEEKMRKGFVEYESSHGIDVNYKSFSLILKNEKNEAVGVLNAFSAFAEIYIDDIWVDKFHRGKGYGKKLLSELENHFKGKGFNNMNLATSSFQAPEFYKKCGFNEEFVRENAKNPKLTKTFFVKFFDDEVQTQGLLKESEKSDSRQENSVSDFSLQSLNPIIQSLNKEINITAVLCYGSYAEGTQDEKSDIDLLIICDEPIPAANIRNELYEKNHFEQIKLQKHHENWETTWTPINDEFVFKGKKIEIGYNLSTWVNNVVTKIVGEGKTTLENFQFRPYTFLGLLENSICLFEKENFLTLIRKQIRPFPSKLKTEIINENLSIFNESVEDLEDFSQRDIGLLAFQFMLFRGLDAAIQIIFAINEVYYPASKREEKHLMRLSKLPQGMHELIYDLLPVFFNRKNEILMRLKEIKIFIEKDREQQ